MGSVPPGSRCWTTYGFRFPVAVAYYSRELAIPDALVAFPDDLALRFE